MLPQNRSPPAEYHSSQGHPESSTSFVSHPLADDLVKWLTRNGGFFSHDVQIVYSESHGFHVRALGPLTSPTIASCPLKLTFSSLNLDPTRTDVLAVQSPLQQCQGQLPEHVLTYLLLIEQRTKADDSPWHPYIACLPPPERMTTPLWFADQDMAFLTGTNLAPAAQERKEELHKQWEQAIHVMKQLGIRAAKDVDFESFLWAATIFTSRAFVSSHILPDGEKIPLLFPVVDILNHSMSAKVVWDFQPRDSFTLKCLEGDAFTAGDELFNNYAPKQNGELLLGYGFCLEDNPVEQFALKLAFSPVLQEYAREMGLLKAGRVPFGMPSEFLKTDPKVEQHFLRPKGHRFGRYENHIAFLRGIPPSIVHLFFVQTLLSLDLDIQDVDIEHPDIRIVLHILVLLHQAIEQRCHSLPLSTQQEPTNQQQRYAKIYRDGQARIIHSIKRELISAIDKLRIWDGPFPPLRPILLSIPEALAVLEADTPSAAKEFQRGLEQHGLHGSEEENMIWTLVLVAFASITLSSPTEDDTLISTWLRDLFARQPLPALEDGIEDAETYSFVDAHIGDFLHLASSSDADASPITVLDDIGLALPQTPLLDAAPSRRVISSHIENLGARLIMWAMLVAEQELLPVLGQGGVRKCLYARPWIAEVGEREDEKWIYEEIEDGDED